MLEELFEKGWVLFVDPDVDIKADYDAIAEFIAEKYLKMFPSWELIECSENFKVEESDRIVEWHNDGKFGMNLTVLYYVDPMEPATGGSISLRNSISGDEEQIYPQAHQLIIMSQKPHIEHKAEFCNIRRHMFNIDFKVKGF